jgi:nucleoredoxin
MRRGLIWVFLLSSILNSRAGQLPLTAKEISLMLRSGYSSNAVMQELARRHFVDTLDATKETTLIKAGAAPELVTALKNGTYSLAPEQAAIAQQQMADQKKRHAIEAEQSRKFDTLYQAQVARDRTSAKAQSPNGDSIYKFLKGDLVRCQSGALVHSDDETLANKKLIAFYFSAHWCGPCRKFTPQLVEYYNRVAPQHPEFEVVFFSFDKSASAMEGYMRETNMPWPAIDYQKLPGKEVLKKNAGDGIPSLVLVDSTGKVISSTYAGTQYLGPAKVLGDLDAIFAGGAARQATASR